MSDRYDQWAWLDDNRGERMLGYITFGLLALGACISLAVIGWKIWQVL